MARFGQVLFSGSRFIFWALSPFLLLFAILMPLLHHGWTPVSIALMSGLDLLALLLLLALYDSKRFHWAGRAATGLVFIAYFLYLADEIRSGKPWGFGPRSDDSPLNALEGLLIIGLPCLRYAVAGRFGWKEQPKYKDGTSEILAPLLGNCSACRGPLDGHEYALFASGIAVEGNEPVINDLLEKARTHQWQALSLFRGWEWDKVAIEAYVLRCGLGGTLMVIRNPFKLHEPETVCLKESITSEDIAVINGLTVSDNWRRSELNRR